MNLKSIILVIFCSFTVMMIQSFVGLLCNNVYIPNLLIALVVIVGFRFGEVPGAICGFFMGLASASLWLEPLGIISFVMTLSGYAGGILQRRIFLDRFVYCYITFVLLLVALALVGYSLTFMLYHYEAKIVMTHLFMDALVTSICFTVYFRLLPYIRYEKSTVG